MILNSWNRTWQSILISLSNFSFINWARVSREFTIDAASAGIIETLKFVLDDLDSQQKMEEKNKKWCNTLSIAVLEGHIVSTKYLVDIPDVSRDRLGCIDNSGVNLEHQAALSGKITMLDYIFQDHDFQ